MEKKKDNIQESLWVLQGTGTILIQGIIIVGISFESINDWKSLLKTQTLVITIIVEFWVAVIISFLTTETENSWRSKELGKMWGVKSS